MKVDFMICLGINILMVMISIALVLGCIVGMGLERACILGFAILICICFKQELVLKMEKRKLRATMHMVAEIAEILENAVIIGKKKK